MSAEVVKLLVVCALGLAALGAVVGMTVTRQIRRFTDALREEERAVEDERREEENPMPPEKMDQERAYDNNHFSESQH